MGTSFALVDSSIRRRAQVVHALSKAKMHVEPYESIREIAPTWRGADAVLVHDEPGALADAINFMSVSDIWLPVVAYAERPVSDQIVQAVQGGASAYLEWPFSPNQLGQVLDRAAKHVERWAVLKRQQMQACEMVGRLTARETQVLECMAGGMANREIGACLDISPRTVEVHRANLLRRLGVRHSTEAIKIAIEAGMARSTWSEQMDLSKRG